MEKICPLLCLAPRGSPVPMNCEQEKCAWWKEDEQRCVVISIPTALWSIKQTLETFL